MLAVNGVMADVGDLAPGLHKLVDDNSGRRYSLWMPDDYETGQPIPLLVALHYGGPVSPHYGAPLLTQLMVPAFGPSGMLMVAPDNNGQGWDNQTSEAEVMALITLMQATFNVDAARIVLTGFSMGGIGTWYLAARQPDVFCAAIPVAGQPPENLDEHALNLPVYVIHARHDEVLALAPTQELVERLKTGGANVELRIDEQLTHYEVTAYSTPLGHAVRWLENNCQPQH